MAPTGTPQTGFGAVEHYLLEQAILTRHQLERLVQLARLWQGTVPIVAWKLGLVDLTTFATLIDLEAGY
ncbi:DUF2949 domain-containing protein [Gloeobacter morelensis]|uniref:DUF2949 domain-containing protein n=1 Tax=Gloeobacter morelensis MG652769 TaxID=2781736 RepID=A0ABY3PRT1_9CYAN|nr:DUF2949 domain-containing protein [Gloeobacter morelensis]UFP96319.1 DUF2949 domain-containing protein [Gloeobacter morelensis MG652769]